MNALANVLKVMDLRAVQEKARSDTVHWRITPALVEEATNSIQKLEVSRVGFASPKLRVSYLEIGPKVTAIISSALIISNKICQVIGGDELGICLGKLDCGLPQMWNGLHVLIH